MNCNQDPFQDQFLDQVAVHVHDTWAKKRISEGWTYGPQRDDTLKQHPDLVPYDQLSPVEQDYDRATAITVIHAILKAGYSIVDKENQPLFNSENSVYQE